MSICIGKVYFVWCLCLFLSKIKYLDTNNLRRVYEEQRGIIRTYKRDITKYDHEQRAELFTIPST